MNDPRDTLLGNWPSFTVRDVANIFGVSRRKVLLWLEQGLIQPAEPAQGTGHPVKFSWANLVHLAVLRYLEVSRLLEPRPKVLNRAMAAFDELWQHHDFKIKTKKGHEESRTSAEFEWPDYLIFGEQGDRIEACFIYPAGIRGRTETVVDGLAKYTRSVVLHWPELNQHLESWVQQSLSKK